MQALDETMQISSNNVLGLPIPSFPTAPSKVEAFLLRCLGPLVPIMNKHVLNLDER